MLWLILIARTLKSTDICLSSSLPTTFDLSLQRNNQNSRRRIQITVDLHPYIGDINPLIITCNSTRKEHEQIIQLTDQILRETAEQDGLSCDHGKDYYLTFSMIGRTSTAKHIGIFLSSNFKFNQYAKQRTKKAFTLSNVLYRLGNSHGGMSPVALRTLYISAMCPILTYGAELYNNHPSTCHNLLCAMNQVESTCLRKICGSYKGMAYNKLGPISNIEPLQVIVEVIGRA